jgi:formylglycine-generating enzyme required for sulfatase activity
MPKWMRGVGVACLAVLAACGTHSAGVKPAPSGGTGGTATPPAVNSLPDLDALAGLGSSPSKWVSKHTSSINGADISSQAGGRNRTEGSAFAIIPGGQDELAYALYTQDGISFDKPASIDFTVEPTAIIPGGQDELSVQFWLGVSDYTTYKWAWFGPFDGNSLSSASKGLSVVRKGASSIFSLSINNTDDTDRYVSAPDGSNLCRMSYVVVCTATDDPDRPHAVKVDISNTDTTADYLTNNPHYVPVFQPDVAQSVGFHGKRASSTGHEVDLGWQHIPSLGAADDRNTAAVYQIWRQGTDESAPVLIDSVNAPQSSYTDPPAGGYPAASPPIQPPTPGVKYTYFVRAINPEQGKTPRAPTHPAAFPIDPPDQLRTELTSDNDTLKVSWNPVDGAKSYDVYYRYASDSFPTLLQSKVSTNSLLTVPDSTDQLLYYTIVANGRDVGSGDSQEARAFRPDYRDKATEGGDAINIDIGAGQTIRFLHVPAGDLQLGSADNEWGHDSTEEPYQDVSMSDFYISETEITNAQWNAFMQLGGYGRDADIWTANGVAWRSSNGIGSPPFWVSGEHNGDNGNHPDYPVVDVSWYEANAFAKWVNEQAQNLSLPDNVQVSLPNEAQWEWAAEGPTNSGDLWLYPWAEMRQFNGGAFNNGDDGQDQLLCNNSTSGLSGDTSTVTAYDGGRSWCGAYNMAGNVAEWTSDVWRDSYPDPWFAEQYDGSDPSGFIAVRGGRMLDDCHGVRTSARQAFANDFRQGGGFEGVGVRLVLIAFPKA